MHFNLHEWGIFHRCKLLVKRGWKFWEHSCMPNCPTHTKPASCVKFLHRESSFSRSDGHHGSLATSYFDLRW